MRFIPQRQQERKWEKLPRTSSESLLHTKCAMLCIFMLVAMKKNLNNFTSIFIFSLSGSFHFLFSVFLFFPQRLHSSEWWSVHVTIWCMRAAAAAREKTSEEFRYVISSLVCMRLDILNEFLSSFFSFSLMLWIIQLSGVRITWHTFFFTRRVLNSSFADFSPRTLIVSHNGTWIADFSSLFAV